MDSVGTVRVMKRTNDLESPHARRKVYHIAAGDYPLCRVRLDPRRWKEWAHEKREVGLDDVLLCRNCARVWKSGRKL